MSTPRILSAFLLLAVLPPGAQSAEDDRAANNHSIVASHEGVPLALALPMPFNVSYHNHSADVWKLYQPDQCTCVEVRVVPEDPESRPVGFRLGKAECVPVPLPDGGHYFAINANVPAKLAIEPGGSFSFDVDLQSRFLPHLRAGRWTCSVTDHVEELTSTPVPMVIVVTRETLDECLEKLNDESTRPVLCAWYGEYLRGVRPDVALDFSGPNRTPAQLTAIRARNAEALEEFTTRWAEERDSELVETALERINEEAGVLEEYRALRDEQAAAARGELEERTREN